MKRKINYKEFILYILLPSLPLLVFWFIPMIISIWISFTDWDYINPKYNYVFLNNYKEMFLNKDFWSALKTTILFAIGTIIPINIFGFILAYLLNLNIRGKNFFRALLFSPWITPMVAVSIVWSWMFRSDIGLINKIIKVFGIDGPDWLSNSNFAIWAVVIVTIWKSTGWAMVFYADSLSKIPEDLYNVGKIEGFNFLNKMKYIIIPMTKKTTFLLIIISLIETIQAYDQFSILTQGGPSGSTRTLLYLFYQTAFEMFKMGKAASVSTIIMIITAVMAFILLRNKKETQS